MTSPWLIPFAALVAAGCAPAPSGDERDPSVVPAASGAVTRVPNGATISPEGYATILDTPPAPYPDAPPAEPPRGEGLVEQYARENGISFAVAADQINGPPDLREEIGRLQPLLRAKEPGNFVEMVMVRDPAVHVNVYFKRDAAATLAKYTDHPLFRARTGGLTHAEIEAVRERWNRRLRAAGLQSSSGGRGDKGKVEFDLGIDAAQFAALKQERGWPDDPLVSFSFAPPQTEPAMPPELEGYIRHFARSPQAPGVVPSLASWGRVYLDGGCFRMAGVNDRDRSDDPLALFGRDAQLKRDDEGYLVVTGRGGEGARIGEEMQLGWAPEVTPEHVAHAEAEALRAACGPGKVVDVGVPQSARGFKIRPSALASYAEQRRLSRQTAWDEMVACWKRQDATEARLKPGEMGPPLIFIACDDALQVERGSPTPPPPPVDDPADCPDGATLSHGLCRDGDGDYVPAKSEPGI